jgi:hypothetical protein
MQWTALISVSLALVAVIGTKLGPPPVILELGPEIPTPAPTPRDAEKKRLITMITVQNNEKGESVVFFEATDFVDEGEEKTRTLATKRYSVAEAEEKPELKPLADKIMYKIRDLEHDMLQFVQKSGPPKARAPMLPGTRPE